MPRATAAWILALAVIGGVLVDIVVPGNAPGIGIVVLMLALLGAAALVAGPAGIARMDRADLWLGPVALLLALCIAVRSEPWLVAADLMLAMATGIAAILSLGGARVTRGLLPAILDATFEAIAAAVVGAMDVLPAARPKASGGVAVLAVPRGAAARLAPVARGLVIAVPLVAIFVALFASADAVFATVARTVVDWRPGLDIDLETVMQRVVVVFGVAWCAAGLLALGAGYGARARFSNERGGGADAGFGPSAPAADDESARHLPPPAPRQAPGAAAAWRGVSPADASAFPRLGSVEATTVLAALDMLFAAFVALQVAYLFGGRDTLAAAGITYADYARRGFFELVAVAVVAGMVIVGLEVLVERRSRIQLAASTALLVLTAVVLASALARLRLYQEAYGWTELRFVVLVAIGWLGAAIAVVGGLLVRRQTRWLLHGLGILTILAVVGMNVVGPGGFVAQENLARAVDPSLVPPDGRAGLDADYLGALGDAAVPPAVAAYPRLSPQDQAAVAGTLTAARARLAGNPLFQGWPAWNLDRQRALDAIRAWQGSRGP